LISEDDVQPSQFLEDFMISSTGTIAEILDNPDYPTHHRLQFLFDSSFQRLSAKEKEALVSLCILPESFNIEVAAAVLDERRNFEVGKYYRAFAGNLFLIQVQYLVHLLCTNSYSHMQEKRGNIK